MALRLMIFLVGFGALGLFAAESKKFQVNLVKWPDRIRVYGEEDPIKWETFGTLKLPPSISKSYVKMRQSALNVLNIVCSVDDSFDILGEDINTINNSIKEFLDVIDDNSKRYWSRKLKLYVPNREVTSFASKVIPEFNKLYSNVGEFLLALSDVYHNKRKLKLEGDVFN